MSMSLDSAGWAIVLPVLIVQVFTVVNNWLAAREARRGRQDLADQAAAVAEEARQARHATEAKAEQVAQDLAEKTGAHQNAVLDASQKQLELQKETLAASVKAFDEANSVNSKIASIGLQTLDGEQLLPHEDAKAIVQAAFVERRRPLTLLQLRKVKTPAKKRRPR